MIFDDLPGDLEDGDRLFNTDGPWQLHTELAWSFIGDYRYVDGFQRAAEVLSAHVEVHRSDVDALTMPILFCYRQWMELRLKDLWNLGAALDDEGASPLRTHDLRVLWRHVRPQVEKQWPDGDRNELDRLESVIHELADMDGPTGTGFRYAKNAVGEASLPRELTINLGNVHTVMGRVARVLDGATEGFHMALEYQREMRDYYGP
jgi:hypothetical protein